MNSIIFNKTNTKFSYEDSIEICYEIIKKNYENFPIYMFFLNKRLMDDFATLYAFSRGIDYIGDELPPKKVIKGLEIWEKELDLAFNNKSTNPIFVALQKGARTLCLHFSLIRSAKLHKLDPYRYYVEIMKKVPYCEKVEDYEALLPWNINLEKVISKD